MSTAEFGLVSQDLYAGRQTWNYDAVWRNNSGTYRVAIHTSNSAEQSSATISVWGVGGWNFHTSLPHTAWWPDAPSYVKRELTSTDRQVFLNVERILLQRLAAGLWGSDSIERKGGEA